MSKPIRIGTRKSRLAQWQASFIGNKLRQAGHQIQLVPVESDGEQDRVTPLYAMGIQGIFTKALDAALLDHAIDLAVHSLKDVPTLTADGILICAVPERGNSCDTLVFKDRLPREGHPFTVATGSLRRRAQWLHRYTGHGIEDLRGNINTRLEKLLSNSGWDAVLFAAAGIERIELPVPHRIDLDWMLPAPGQGALAVTCRADDTTMQGICRPLNHHRSELCTTIERDFMRAMMGGCSMPIAALAEIVDEEIRFRGNVLTLDGVQKADIDLRFTMKDASEAGARAARELRAKGGQAIVDTFGQTQSGHRD